jgi:hypothetical protein
MFVHNHIKYGVADFLGDIGGVAEIFIFIFGFLLLPLSRQSFTLKSIKNLYSVRTSDGGLLQRIENGQPHPVYGKPRKEVRFEFEDND